MKWLINRLDPFAAADGPPPTQLWPFFRWAIRGTLPWCTVAAGLSSLVGVIEVSTAIILGAVIDSALASGTQTLWSDNTLLFVGALLFFLLLRPLTFGLSSAVTSILVVTNLNPLVHSRLHRWVLGQNISFFDNDFAGRIAQKEMQAARAVSDVVGETINVAFFALASLFGSVLLLTTINVSMAIGLGVWAVFYLLAIRWFLPRVRARGKARAGARAHVTGQVVDTITNIKTVKLFARRSHEDSAAIDALGNFREQEYHFKVMATLFRFTMISLARHPARRARRRNPVPLDARHRHTGRNRHRRGRIHPHRPDDRLGRLHRHGDLRQHRRGRRRHAHPRPRRTVERSREPYGPERRRQHCVR